MVRFSRGTFPVCGQISERIVQVPDIDSHPGGRLENAFSGGIGLGKQFGHPVFGMDFLYSESLRENPVKFIPSYLFPSSLHPSGFYDNQFRETDPVIGRKIQQREADSEQYGFLFFLFQTQEGLPEILMVIKIKTACGGSCRAVSGKPDQMLGHIDQRRTFPFQIRGQQGQNRIFLRPTVK